MSIGGGERKRKMKDGLGGRMFGKKDRERKYIRMGGMRLKEK